jgi:hypothetical protein
MAEQVILKKGSEAYAKGKEQFYQRFIDAAEKKEPGLETGTLGARVGNLTKDLPMPFGCPDLEIVFFQGGAIAYFCGRLGCLCSPLREDFDGDYPDCCPPEGYLDYGPPDNDDEDEYDDNYDDDD